MTAGGPRVGIWWDDGATLAALTRTLAEVGGAKPGGWRDADDAHADRWSEVCRRFGLGRGDEYFVVPRGRVQVDDRGRGRVLHGDGTPPDRLAAVAAAFGLTDWVSLPDDHYSVGPAADRLTDDRADD